MGLDYSEKYANRIRSVPREEVLRVAKTYLHPENCILIVVANLKEAGAEYSEYCIRKRISNVVTHLLVTLRMYLDQYAYWAVFAADLLEGCGLPMPGATLLIAASFLASRGDMHIISVLFTAWVGTMTGSFFGYAIVEVIVVPPSLIPIESGNKVKTDKRDSRKLAKLLESNLLKRVCVLTEEDRVERELLRTRRQILEHRNDVARQIKSKLLFYGIRSPFSAKARWTKGFLRWLKDLPFEREVFKVSFQNLFDDEAVKDSWTLLTTKSL